jgi:hypothetical protein
VALGDLDADGDIDAFVANNNGQPDTVWLNHGDATFEDSGERLGASYSRRVTLGDLDNDGDLDAFVADANFNLPNLIWLNDGMGTFFDSGQSPGYLPTYHIALGDLNGDGFLDAFFSNYNYNQPNLVWMNDGTAIFNDSGESLGISSSACAALGDLDGDGDLDAFVGNIGPNKVWLNYYEYSPPPAVDPESDPLPEPDLNSEPAPAELATQLLDFYENALQEGSLTGNGRGKSAGGRENAVKNMLQSTIELIADHDSPGACGQLQAIYRKTDGTKGPQDFVGGDAAGQLAEMISTLMDSMNCPDAGPNH